MSVKRKTQYRDALLQLPRLLLICSIVTAVVSGILIACYYIPTPEKAALSLKHLNEQVFAGAVILSIHRLSGILALLFTLCNLLLLLPAKNISDTWQKIWRSGLVVCVMLVGLQISGHLLTGSSTAVYLFKVILAKIFKTGTVSQGFPQLFDSLSIAFVRVYLLHGIILPAIAGWFLYTHIKALKQLHADLKPLLLPPVTVFTLFCLAVISITLLVKPVMVQVGTCGDMVLESVPWSIKFMLSVKQIVPLSIVVPACVILFLVFWFMRTLIKRFKP